MIEARMEPKKFHLQANEILQLAPGRGGCIATDMITVHGQRVGYMYRLAPDSKSKFHDMDSGWTFLAGTESQDYLDEPRNLAIYDVNTIANYDPEIIPLLDSPLGSAFARESISGRFIPTAPPPTE
jgi:hypothetical protein